jgi:hypothetical protein
MCILNNLIAIALSNCNSGILILVNVKRLQWDVQAGRLALHFYWMEYYAVHLGMVAQKCGIYELNISVDVDG